MDTDFAIRIGPISVSVYIRINFWHIHLRIFWHIHMRVYYKRPKFDI